MIYGIGVDVVEIRRIETLLQRFGERFSRRILSGREWSEFDQGANPARYLAKRFAAKEALSKALDTGIRHPVGFSAISIVKDELGKPDFLFHGELLAYLAERGIASHHLSISDEESIACAFVVLEK